MERSADADWPKDDTEDRRAEIARRLKAARWLAGGTTVDHKGKTRATALSPDALAARPPLPENKITASLIGSIERMERHTPPMELGALALALGVAEDFFTSERQGVESKLDQILEHVERLSPTLAGAFSPEKPRVVRGEQPATPAPRKTGSSGQHPGADPGRGA